MANYIVYGLGISGIATAKFLNQNHFNVIATDDNISLLAEFAKSNPEIPTQNPENLNFDHNTIICFSPGIPLFFPQKHKILDICAKTGAKLLCDLEIFYNFNNKNNFIGITGTNGKSTTTALVGDIFAKLNLPSAIGGNIGFPSFNLPQNHNNFNYIFETSSYQLDLISKLKFNIACLLNITPDHIDRHGTFDNYITSKKRIFLNQTRDDFAIINIDDPNSFKVFNDLVNDTNFQANLIKISTQKTAQNCVTVIDNKVSINIANQEFNFTINPIIKGEHNAQNIACAIAVMSCYFIKNSQFNFDNLNKIIKIIENFAGLKHRLQLVRKINNISFINDSKATNAESSEKALKSYDNIFWIVGGKAKEGGIDILKPYFTKIKKAYLIGESCNDFAQVFADNGLTEGLDYEKCHNLQQAFEASYLDAKNSNLKEINIILSPACASFDQWKNFEERGDFFCKLINDI